MTPWPNSKNSKSYTQQKKCRQRQAISFWNSIINSGLGHFGRAHAFFSSRTPLYCDVTNYDRRKISFHGSKERVNSANKWILMLMGRSIGARLFHSMHCVPDKSNSTMTRSANMIAMIGLLKCNHRFNILHWFASVGVMRNTNTNGLEPLSQQLLKYFIHI